ncbi:MAG: 30S ribosomal protein S17 [Coxiellaceae bacterium]|nr:30S ribosomal protein S17 [Coxiellaceae bacterium]
MSTLTKCTRTLSGKVISNRMNKTIIVLVERKIKHPIYEKYIKRSSKIHAHDEDNTCHEGDVVTITESRPISRTKKWKLVAIIEKGAKINECKNIT